MSDMKTVDVEKYKVNCFATGQWEVMLAGGGRIGYVVGGNKKYLAENVCMNMDSGKQGYFPTKKEAVKVITDKWETMQIRINRWRN